MKRKQKDYRDYFRPIDRSYLKYNRSKVSRQDYLRMPMRSRYDWPDAGCSRDTWKFIQNWLDGMSGRPESEVWLKFKTLLRWSSRQVRWYWWTWDIDDCYLEHSRNSYYFNEERILSKYR